MTKTERFELPLAPDEKAAFRAAATAQGLPLATWARLALRHAAEKHFAAPPGASPPVKRQPGPRSMMRDVDSYLDFKSVGRAPTGERLYRYFEAYDGGKWFGDLKAHAVYERDARLAFARGVGSLTDLPAKDRQLPDWLDAQRRVPDRAIESVEDYFGDDEA